jgi:hypothetical protein
MTSDDYLRALRVRRLEAGILAGLVVLLAIHFAAAYRAVLCRLFDAVGLR